MSELHPLLARSLRRIGVSRDEAPPVDKWHGLLELVGRMFREADQDRYTLERSIDISSREMQGLYQELKERSETELAVERRRVEESLAVLRATLEASCEGIIVVDAAGRLVAANVRMFQMFGVADEVARSGDHKQILAHALSQFRDPEQTRATIARLYDSSETLHDEIELVDNRVLERYSAPVRFPDGTCAGRVTFFRDVTTEREARRAIENARKAAEHASQARSMFLANMSHELRTPLNAVIGLTDLLLLDGADAVTPYQKKCLDTIAESGRHLLAMVNDILDMTKIDAGRYSLELEEVRPESAIEQAIALVEPIARERDMSVSADPGPALPAIRADPVRLRQILLNLLSNAVKFGARGGSVRVTAQARDAGVAISVSDDGIGIPREKLPRLFHAFDRLDVPTGEHWPGTGLGLALTKRLVELHRGRIAVVSKPGLGTTFIVQLPSAL